MNCSECAVIEPVEDEGTVKFRPCPASLAEAVRAAGIIITDNRGTGTITYASREELMNVLKLLGELEMRHAAPLAVSISGAADRVSVERWLSLEQINVRFANDNLIDIIAGHNFCSHMQPIVNFNEEIVGFELLLRPLPQGSPFKPYELFEVARQTGFHSFLDRAARISAIETGARMLPKGIKRFINFLPSSIYNPKYCLTHTFEAIDRLGQDPQDFVFEVVETESIRDISQLQSIFSEYRRQGMKVALDDVGAGYSTVEVMTSLQPDYVKIDRDLISFCDEDAAKQKIIFEILNRASSFGAHVLAEGIERREEFLYCREQGINLAQGYLFGKPEDKPPVHFESIV
ncbi:hypothetical protein C2I18_13845 [Paenibacillus sp. PK3_47]|uniref:EAL domain-containing protein n=1 Tax=Paenibacillus sp. PK3_47 TaxID=2072642 RepID=UPI00201D502A|nr:EAL domain-containing protein [Paenibacillus sp. PK3_47]UQZ34504.1 hypothetical protein C2I18_13845 [Paenibacillus sp. PK3_47]